MRNPVQSGFYTPGSDLDIALYGEVELKLLPESVRIETAKLVTPGRETAPMVSRVIVSTCTPTGEVHSIEQGHCACACPLA